MMSPLVLTRPTMAIRLSYWAFVVWWLLILAVHAVTSVHNGLYAYTYWTLNGTYLNTCLEFYEIGMPLPYHKAIAIVLATTSSIHGVCILLMLWGSFRQRSLAFTPWSTSTVGDESKAQRTSSGVLRSFSKLYAKLTYPCGACGVRGEYFEVALVCREILETALQTVQAYRMSMLLPRTVLNRFYVILLAANCWSSVIVYTALFKHDEARRRFACIVLDCALDLMACMGVEFIILLSYMGDYDATLKGFPEQIWYNDKWVARALNELQMVVVVSWSDLVSRAVFSLGLVVTTTSMKRLLWCLPRKEARVSHSVSSNVVAVRGIVQSSAASLVPLELLPAQEQAPQRLTSLKRMERVVNQRGHVVFRAIHVMFAALGIAVLGLHIHASSQPTLDQCLMQVRPWAVSRPSCYLVGLDCHSLGSSGDKEEVSAMWSEFDAATVVQLLIRHCPDLQVPDIFREFRGLRGIKVYNTTITDWGESAAITGTSHPRVTTLFIARVNMTDGLLPPGFQSDDFPQTLYDIEICVTNLRELPDDLDSKWPPGAVLYIEYSQLAAVPLVLTRLAPMYLSVAGNPITELPPELFEIEGVLYLSVGETNISELPRNVTTLSLSLYKIFLGQTNISFFWAWMDTFVERYERSASPPLLIAAGSTYCRDFERIQNGTSDAFQVPMSPEYSTVLTNPSADNWPAITKAVKCVAKRSGLMYSLGFDDSINAISTPPALVIQS